MRFYSQNEIEYISRWVYKTYKKTAGYSEMPERVIPEQLADCLGLSFDYRHLSRDRLTLGLTSFEEGDGVEVFDSPFEEFYVLDGKTMLIEEDLQNDEEKVGRCNFTKTHEVCHHILHLLYPAVPQTAEAAACLDADSWALMRECYEKVPEAPKKQVSTGKPAEHTKDKGQEGKNMDLENMTVEQLKEQAPRLYEAAMQEGRKAGIADERDRMQAIDELTDEGYEDLAQKAKNEGWTESAFLKELRKAKADRKKEFLKERKGETGAAEQVLGGSQGDQDGNAEEEMKKFRKEAKEMAEELTGASSGGMF